MTASLRRKLGTAIRMRRADQRLALEAIAALLLARLRGLLPFRILARHLGGLVSPPARHPPEPLGLPSPLSGPLSAPLSAGEEQVVVSIRWAIGAVAPWMPFRTLCLQQAIAARAMLARRGIGSILHLGVGDPTGTRLEAHAWLDTGGLKVTGYPVDPALAEVGRFT